MTTEVKRLIRVRVEKGASFKRDGFGKKRQLSDSWRKPRGQHNKQREQKKAKGALPKPGFGSPIAVRGMHPSGFFEVLVASAKELEGLDPKTQAIRIGATVGDRKRLIIQEKAGAAGLKVLNARIVKAEAKKPEKAAAKTEGKEKKAEKPSKTKAPAAPAKKDAAKAKPAPKAEEKAPAKAAKSAKPKAESAEKPAAKKAPAKAAKPAAEKDAEAKPTAAAKPKAKTTKSGVKKNE
ncbi:50S ribosomal protein L32e [uncultured Methanoregula sp.]|uniref:50S ribosomal protein L32e n=1 Tax=uncultured Methanoregula sp. TaxID=1005933 RepID=UPI002AAB0046|nr:50S ribosomal protein L32e [uncultured Methanoregula sp.]